MVGLSTNSCFFLIFVHGPGSLVPSNTAAHHRELCRPNDLYGTGATLSTTLGLEGVPSLVMNLSSCRPKNWSKGFRPNKVVKSPSGSENKKSTDFQFVPYKKCHKNAITIPGHHAPFPTQPSSIPETWWDDRKERHGPHRLSANLHHEKHNNFWFKVKKTTYMYPARDMNCMYL